MTIRFIIDVTPWPDGQVSIPALEQRLRSELTHAAVSYEVLETRVQSFVVNGDDDLAERIETLVGDAYELGIKHAMNRARTPSEPRPFPEAVEAGWATPLAEILALVATPKTVWVHLAFGASGGVQVGGVYATADLARRSAKGGPGHFVEFALQKDEGGANE